MRMTINRTAFNFADTKFIDIVALKLGCCSIRGILLSLANNYF